MAVSDTLWHLIIRVRAHGTGMGRRLSYDLSDVLRDTQDGADPLAEWAERRPGDVALWVMWNPILGIRYAGVTTNVDALGNVPFQGRVMTQSMRNAVLDGIDLAMRIDCGEFGHGVDGASTCADGFVTHGMTDGRSDGELIDPDTLEIKDGE